MNLFSQESCLTSLKEKKNWNQDIWSDIIITQMKKTASRVMHLYGYSVLNLDSLQCMHFIPAESYGTYPDEFKETFIWCDCFYNPENNLLAVDGCFWACPGDVIVLDFKDPMTAVEPNDWHSIYRRYRCDDPDLDDIEFDSWDNDTLVCKAIGVKPDAIDLEGKCKVRFV